VIMGFGVFFVARGLHAAFPVALPAALAAGVVATGAAMVAVRPVRDLT
jgi:hypothetical protein